MNTENIQIHQSLYTTYGTIDLTISDDALVELGHDVRAHTGMRSTAVLLWDDTVPPADLAEAQRSLTSAGFTLERIPSECISSALEQGTSSLASYVRLVTLLSEKNITASDALIAIGGGDLLNLVLAVASSYARKLPGPIACALLPTTYDTLLLASAYSASLPLLDNGKSHVASEPLAFSPGSFSPALSFIGNPSFIATTPVLLQTVSGNENLLLAQALMVKGAFLDSQNAWEAFLKDIDELANAFKELQTQAPLTDTSGTEPSNASNSAEPSKATCPHPSEPSEATCLYLSDTSIYFHALARAAKSLALVEHAQTIQVRSTSSYGSLFAAALGALDSSITHAQALAEGMRISADLGVALHNMPLDYAIEQSAALETLGLPEIKQLGSKNEILEDAFLAEVKHAARQTSRSLQAVVPMAPGKLGLTPLSDELLKMVYRKRFIEC